MRDCTVGRRSETVDSTQVDCHKTVDSTRDQQPCVDCTVVAGQRIDSSGLS